MLDKAKEQQIFLFTATSKIQLPGSESLRCMDMSQQIKANLRLKANIFIPITIKHININLINLTWDYPPFRPAYHQFLICNQTLCFVFLVYLHPLMLSFNHYNNHKNQNVQRLDKTMKQNKLEGYEKICGQSLRYPTRKCGILLRLFIIHAIRKSKMNMTQFMLPVFVIV